jgi:hypothetical protein
MRAIIIDDKDSRTLLDSLKLEAMKLENNMKNEQPTWVLIQDIHQSFHYVVCRWLQDQGCNVIR